MSTTDPFTDAMAAAFYANDRPRRSPRGMLRAVAIGLIVVGLLAIGVAASAPAPAAQGWCNWPDDASVAALEHAIDDQVDYVHRYSPGAKLDRFTIQVILMAQCAEGA